MDSSREERRLQRQRGAQRHQVQDVDFGSPFPSIAVSQRVTRSGAALQSELPAQPSGRRTPTSRGRGSTSKSTLAQNRTTPTPGAATNDENRSANTSAKRRKLDTTRDAQPPSPTRDPTSQITLQGGATNETQEGTTIEPAPMQSIRQEMFNRAGSSEELDQVQSTTQTPKSQRLRNISDRGMDEIAESPRNAPGSGHRQQVIFQEAQIPGIKLFENLEKQAPTARMTSHDGDTSTKLPHLHSSRNLHASLAADAVDVVDELSPDRSSKSLTELQQEQFSDQEVGVEAEAEAISDTEAVKQLQRERKRKSRTEVLELQAEIEKELEQEDEQYEDVEPSPKPLLIPKRAAKQRQSRVKASPAIQRQPKKKLKLKSTSTSGKSKETIPVIVHRLTKPMPYDEDDTDADLLNEDIPYAKRSGVNAVDVLSQFCEEVVESGLAALEEGGSNAEDAATRKEYRTKLRAIEAFQEELRTRLLELTIILDTNYLLNKRVKAAQKEKIVLRENLLRVRAEREKIALRMDEVRIKHENRSKEAQEQAALSAALHDIELAVSHGMDKTSAGEATTEPARADLSILLRNIAGTVSSHSPEGGILKQVKSFNAFLENAAVALEARL